MKKSDKPAVYFTQASLEGFAAAINSKLQVSTAFATGQPRTDGQVVYLPSISGSMTEDKFRDLCATAIHESAHVRFDSIVRHRTFIKYHQCPHKSVVAAAFNCALDVADETAIMSYLAGAKKLLDDANYNAAIRIVTNNEFAKRDKCWAIVATGIILARGKCAKFEKYARLSPLWPFMEEVINALGDVRFRKYTPRRMRLWSWGRGVHRFSKEWRLIEMTANKIVEILLRAGCTDGEGDDFGDQREPGNVHGDEDGQGDGPAQPEPGDVVGPGVAGEILDDAPVETPKQNPDRYTGNGNGNKPDAGGKGTATGNGGGGSGAGTTPPPGGNSYDYCIMDQNLYDETMSQLRGPIQRLAEVDDCGGCRGAYASGHDIGDEIERISIDGNVFGKREEEGEDLHVFMSLDISGSMLGKMQQAQAVAQAFADAVRPFANSVTLSTFSTMTNVCTNYHRVHKADMGGTCMNFAVNYGHYALSSLSGRRIMVIIGDGMTSYEEECNALCTLCASIGIQIIAIAYTCPAKYLQSALPTAYVVEADNPNELAMQLSRIGSMIVR